MSERKWRYNEGGRLRPGRRNVVLDLKAALLTFLRARIDEDEAAAQRASEAVMRGELTRYSFPPDLQPFLSTVAPARVFAECEAKRERVELLADITTRTDDTVWPYPAKSLAWDLLYHEAKLWSEHPDFTEDWKP